MPPSSSRKPLPHQGDENRHPNRASLTDERETAQTSQTCTHLSETSARRTRRPLPQPLETSTTHLPFQKPRTDDDSPPRDHSHHVNVLTSVAPSAQPPMDPPSPNPKPKARRFAPQMIETSRRRRKSADTVPAVLSSDKIEESPGDHNHLNEDSRPTRPGALPVPPTNSPIVSRDRIPQAPESKFSSSKLAEKQQRQHSFRVPDLPAIPSQSGTESNASSLPSLSASPSADSDETEQGAKKRKRKVRARRESQDAQWSGYLLSLAAKTAEKQLREQAMAAYPNEHAHEPVDHYAIDRDSDGEGVEVGVGKLSVDGPSEEEVADGSPVGHHRHRESATGFDLAEMRKHQARLEQERKDHWVADPGEVGRRRSTRKALQEAENSHKDAELASGAQRDIMGWQKDNEMKPMQKAASPPMAGANLIFPKSQSPKATRLDVNQYPGIKRSNGTETRQHTGLWTPGSGTSRQSSLGGLWNGVCSIANQEIYAPPKMVQTGLLTPGPDRGDPFLSSPSPSPSKSNERSQLPPSPPSSQEATSNLDIILRRDQSIEAEFDDHFVTQVYNYLSLGYPSLARKYDFELSKIARIPLEDLRKDDNHCNAKGHVGAPESTGVEARGAEGAQKCERWRALKQYVREWGRQQPGMCGAEELDGGWGARARKGSWAI